MNYLRIDPPLKTAKRVLALGAQSKSSFCFSKNGSLYVSIDGGDLAGLEDLERFESLVNRLKKRLKPDVIACDLHPEYASSKLAEDWVRKGKERLRTVQHHEAHLAGCMTDNKIKGDVIGVVFDGTGLGLDGNIWGGEFFIGNIKDFKRAAHLKYVPMPGGELSIREPWRMALSYLYGAGIGFPRRWDRTKTGLIVQAIDKGINSPLTSSMGRLFDAVSSLAGIRDRVEYEAQGPIELEKIIAASAAKTDNYSYGFDYRDENETIIIDWNSLIKGVVKDSRLGKNKADISLKFHNAIRDMIKDACNLLREKHGIRKVCMSGGVFQNRYLARNIPPLLKKEGFEVYLHRNIPPHDGNIALGQAVIAAAR